MGLIERLAQSMSLRLRIFMFFLLALTTCLAMVGFAGWLFLGGLDAQSMAMVGRAGAVSAFAIAAIIIAIWYQFDTHVARPIERMGRYAHSAAHAGGLSDTAMPDARYLGYLAPAVADLSQALDAARNKREQAVGEAVARAERQKARLESVLHDLRDGILICNRDHQVLLYNPRAVQILDEVGQIGLRRSVFDVLSPGPVRHSVARLVKRFRENRHLTHDEGLSLPFAALCADGRTTIEATMTLTLVPGSDEPEGYILSFSDETETLAASAEAERQLIAVAEKIREEAASMHLIGELLGRSEDLPEPAREMTGAIMREVRTLTQSADLLDGLAQDQLARTWPMAPVLATTLFDLVGERVRVDAAVTHHAEPGVTILCDSAAIAALLARLAEWISELGGSELTVSAIPGDPLGFVDLSWLGEALMIRDVNTWLASALDHDLGPVTAADVLARHASDVWPEELDGGRARLRMPLTMRDASRMRVLPVKMPERRAYYDFDLFDHDLPENLADIRLDQLTAVVFDTETTGLEPGRGDKMVSIAGVRVVNGRLLEGEVFNEFINPGRPIPPASTVIHGISDEMVAEAGPTDEVTRRFHGFARDAVLVAHNAPFDMRFLSMAAEPAGFSFTNPVLDTVLLAAHLHGAEDSLTLDRLAEVYGISLPDEVRHTAHGDALATAGVFLRLIDPLAAAGVATLGEAMAASEAQAALRRKQAKY